MEKPLFAAVQASIITSPVVTVAAEEESLGWVGRGLDVEYESTTWPWIALLRKLVVFLL